MTLAKAIILIFILLALLGFIAIGIVISLIILPFLLLFFPRLGLILAIGAFLIIIFILGVVLFVICSGNNPKVKNDERHV